ncbi:cupin-like domain-containing protein [Embleya sp. NPDC005575]|uniref:cupin-like domain-containing protein n=1 Tax=Embleya sp. NPDC005575 TaxID=3156892 RepID=UPI00339E61E8
MNFVVEHRAPSAHVGQWVRAHAGRCHVYRGVLKDSAALRRWSTAELAEQAGSQRVRVKSYADGRISVDTVPFGDYVASLTSDQGDRPESRYLHDVPLLEVFPDARGLVGDIPAGFVPRWYADGWERFAQLFIGPAGARTPFHFDCLLTHNSFFQVDGTKRFYLVPARYRTASYLRDWRWSQVDAARPDLAAFPEFTGVPVHQVDVGPGDVLYMPPGTLHQVHSLTASVSFNIDWHTRTSVLTALAAAYRGMPAENTRYNLMIAGGLFGRGRPHEVLRRYGSYLSYVS